MFAVVFEVHPATGKKDEYLGLAKHLDVYKRQR